MVYFRKAENLRGLLRGFFRWRRGLTAAKITSYCKQIALREI